LDDNATSKEPASILKGKEELQEATLAAQAERTKLQDGFVTTQFSQSESCFA
jgi:hypothetical protein